MINSNQKSAKFYVFAPVLTNKTLRRKRIGCAENHTGTLNKGRSVPGSPRGFARRALRRVSACFADQTSKTGVLGLGIWSWSPEEENSTIINWSTIIISVYNVVIYASVYTRCIFISVFGGTTRRNAKQSTGVCTLGHYRAAGKRKVTVDERNQNFVLLPQVN